MSRLAKQVLLLFVLAAVVLAVAPGANSQPGASQIILSGQTPPGTTTGTLGPMGFWIWCESPDAANPYAGLCAGSMYFYELGLVRSVFGGVTAINGTVTVDVASADDEIDCTLTASTSPNKGPNNDVTVNCEDPARSGTLEGAVVRVT